MAAPGLLQGAAITTACELKERIDLMKYEEIRDQLAAMTYRQREAFKARYRFREHTLENWDDMSWQTSAKLIRALKAEREERERKEQLKP
jgi:hypothetical protein